MSQRGRPRTRTGAVRTGMSQSAFQSLMEDWQSEEEDESDKEELHGEEDDWIEGGDDDDDASDNNNNDEDDSQPQRNLRILGTGTTHTRGDDLEEADDPNDQQPRVRVGRNQRDIKSLAEALNPQNYDMLVMPSVAQRKDVSAVLQKKKGNQPRVDINFKNWKRTNRGRNPKQVFLFI